MRSLAQLWTCLNDLQCHFSCSVSWNIIWVLRLSSCKPSLGPFSSHYRYWPSAIVASYWCCPHSMRTRVYATVESPSVRLSVPSIDNSNGCRWLCCWAPCGQETSIDSYERAAAPCCRRAGAQQQMRVTSCQEPTEEAQQRLVDHVERSTSVYNTYLSLSQTERGRYLCWLHKLSSSTAIWTKIKRQQNVSITPNAAPSVRDIRAPF